MARFMIKASEFKNVCKAVNDRKLAELKKEIIEILKKQDEKEVKKAIDYFNSQELHYTHLEKSFIGKWIEKAGYGIGTVRIWKGKKYKKIAPGKWARVFDKEGRGTNIAIGKLIARVQKIDNVEDLMAFVMQNKQRFVDENGVDLPVLDKLRAAVDERNGNVGSKGTSKPAEKGNKKSGLSDDARIALLNLHDRNKDDAQSILSKYIKNTKDETQKRAYEEAYNYLSINDMPKFKDGKIVNEKPAEKKEDDSKAYEGKLATQKQVDEATAISNKYEVSRNEMLKKPITTIQKYANSTVEDFEGGIDKFIEHLAEGRSEGVSMDEVGKEFAKLINHNVARKIWDDYESGALVPDKKGILKPKEESEAEKESNSVEMSESEEVPFGGVDKNDKGEGIEYLEMADKINEVARKGELKVGDAIFKVDKEGKEWVVRSEIANAIRCKEGIDKINTEFEKTAKLKLEAKLKEKLDKIKEKLPEVIKEGKLEENKKLVDERLKRYSENADEGITVNEVISKYKNKLINKLEKHVKDNELFTSKNRTDIELLSDIDHQVELCSNHLSAAFYTECKKLLEERGVKVEKSVFGDFITDMLVDEVIKDEEDVEENESEYNDYSAEQPELFNSTEFLVREALNRRYNCM